MSIREYTETLHGFKQVAQSCMMQLLLDLQHKSPCYFTLIACISMKYKVGAALLSETVILYNIS